MKFYIYAKNQETVSKKLNKIFSKLSKKPSVTFGEPVLARCKWQWLNADGTKADKRKIRFISMVEVNIEDIFLSDWVLVANVSHIRKAFNIVSYKYFNKTPIKYGPDYTYCDVCEKNHKNRNMSHVLYNPVTNKWMQVGTACLHKISDCGKYIATPEEKINKVIYEANGYAEGDENGMERVIKSVDHADFNIAVDKYELLSVVFDYYKDHNVWIKANRESRTTILNMYDDAVNNNTITVNKYNLDCIIKKLNNLNYTSDFCKSMYEVINSELVNLSDIHFLFYAVKMYYDDIKKQEFIDVINANNIITGNKYTVCGTIVNRYTVDAFDIYSHRDVEVTYTHIKDNASGIVFITTSREIEKFYNADTNQYEFIGIVGNIDYRNFDIKVKGRLSRVK